MKVLVRIAAAPGVVEFALQTDAPTPVPIIALERVPVMAV